MAAVVSQQQTLVTGDQRGRIRVSYGLKKKSEALKERTRRINKTRFLHLFLQRPVYQDCPVYT